MRQSLCRKGATDITDKVIKPVSRQVILLWTMSMRFGFALRWLLGNDLFPSPGVRKGNVSNHYTASLNYWRSCHCHPHISSSETITLIL